MSELDRYQCGYDQNSNRLYKANVVGTPIVSTGLDELYVYDDLNRLYQFGRGILDSTMTYLTGTPERIMLYYLDALGNWRSYQTQTNGTTDLNQGRAVNTVNEITSITASGSTPLWVTPAYDPAGNMTTMPQVATPTSSFTATYDAWNRMTSISASGSTVATYQYDGRNRRIVKYTAATSETRHFYFTNDWQDVEERTGTSTTADTQYVWGIRYVDELVCRDTAATPTRLYALQDANFNLTAITDTAGTVQERYYYDPYGYRSILNGSWGGITSSAYAWVIGHQGLCQDTESYIINDRNRFIHVLVATFMMRDLAQYMDGNNLYVLLLSNPYSYIDPDGSSARRNPPLKLEPIPPKPPTTQPGPPTTQPSPPTTQPCKNKSPCAADSYIPDKPGECKDGYTATVENRVTPVTGKSYQTHYCVKCTGGDDCSNTQECTVISGSATCDCRDKK